jgi:hypothetical protein
MRKSGTQTPDQAGNSRELKSNAAFERSWEPKDLANQIWAAALSLKRDKIWDICEGFCEDWVINGHREANSWHWNRCYPGAFSMLNQ